MSRPDRSQSKHEARKLSTRDQIDQVQLWRDEITKGKLRSLAVLEKAFPLLVEHGQSLAEKARVPH
ncbi:MAG: hypothetical protein ABI220_03600 [Candidatus Saccharimonadales bacterium]